MSLIGTHTAVVSLGMSCQSAHQIRLHAKLISTCLRSGEALDASRLPFDWLICPPSSVLKILESGRFFPDHRDALELDHAPYWRDYHTYFWHDFLDEDRHYDLSLDFQGTRDKYERLAEKFRALSKMRRLVFVISNSQNNLDFVADRTQALTPGMSASHIEELCDATDQFFGRRCEYLVVSYADRLDRRPARRNVKVYPIGKDPSEWRGEPDTWARVFTEYFETWPDASLFTSSHGTD
ncbi:hypothetical protein [Microvirga sp. TS319]|uniref:hypothetical protein n=1 Tax=Microvirga sp. TS319 TaxID=3241165 RepID=UPI003519F546